ncbi:MAG: rhodanese-related sulfurtransferase, partial [Rhizobiales bacterium]|nr:rhodanese-related sulfurtransferase [Hyphomicrobiales bacterium]
TRNARTVLIDNDGVRAKASAYWLARMGYRNIHVFTASSTKQTETGDEPATSNVEGISAEALVSASGKVVADIRRSPAYRRGHIPGAWFLTRAKLDRDVLNLPDGDIVLVSDDPAYASLVSRDLKAMGRNVQLLDGGMPAWRAAGGDVETGLTALASVPDDSHVNPRDLDTKEQMQREFRRYLDWEIGLIDMLDGEPAALWMT